MVWLEPIKTRSTLLVLTAKSFDFWYEFLIDINKWNRFPIANKSPFLFGMAINKSIYCLPLGLLSLSIFFKNFWKYFQFISENALKNFTYILKTNTFLSPLIQLKGAYIKYVEGVPEGFTNFSKKIVLPRRP